MRAPFNALVLPFRRTDTGTLLAVLELADDGAWQPICGGGEDSESTTEAARRETTEESGLPADAPLYRLDMVSGVPKTEFRAQSEWPAELYIVTKHYFAPDVTTEHDLRLSDEHSEYRWLAPEDAVDLLRYDDDKSAAWEVAARLDRDDLPAPSA